MTAELTRKQRDRRIAVVRDAKAQALASAYAFEYGTGFVVPRWYDSEHVAGIKKLLAELDDDADLQPHVDAIAGHCDVCARGALLLSHVRLNDRLKAGAVKLLMDDTGVLVDRALTTEALAETFDPFTLMRIESAFERCQMYPAAASLTAEELEELNRCARAFMRHTKPRARFVAICDDILAHDGTFFPEVAETAEAGS